MAFTDRVFSCRLQGNCHSSKFQAVCTVQTGNWLKSAPSTPMVTLIMACSYCEKHVSSRSAPIK